MARTVWEQTGRVSRVVCSSVQGSNDGHAARAERSLGGLAAAVRAVIPTYLRSLTCVLSSRPLISQARAKLSRPITAASRQTSDCKQTAHTEYQPTPKGYQSNMPSQPPAFPKVFFILPMTRYAPDDFIRLGQVVADPLEPWVRLADPIPLEGELRPRTATTTEWSCRSTSSSFAEAGAFARVLDLLTAEVSRSSAAGRAQTFEAARLETVFFEPGVDRDLGEKLVGIAEVRKHLSRIRWAGGSAYLITGLKIARSPGTFTTESTSRADIAAKLEAAVDGGQVPGGVQLGVDFARGRDAGVDEEGVPSEDYVFAYRMSKIYVTWLTGKVSLGKVRDGGDLQGVGGGEEDEWEGSDFGDYLSDHGDEAGDADGQDGTDWEIKTAQLEDGDFGMQLPTDAFETKEVDDGVQETYYLVKNLG